MTAPESGELNRAPRPIERPRHRSHQPHRPPNLREPARRPVHPEPPAGSFDTDHGREVRVRERGLGKFASTFLAFGFFATATAVTFVGNKMMSSTEGLAVPQQDPVEAPLQPTSMPAVTQPPSPTMQPQNTAPQATEATASPTTQAPATTVRVTQTPTTLTIDLCTIPADRTKLNEAHISAIQQVYFDLGLYGESESASDHVDGSYGPNTINAENTFQTNNNIDPVLDWNEQTRNILFGC